MNRKKKYDAPVIAVLVMEPAVMLVDSVGGNSYKVTGQTGDSDYPLEYGGEGGGAMYDPD